LRLRQQKTEPITISASVPTKPPVELESHTPMSRNSLRTPLSASVLLGGDDEDADFFKTEEDDKDTVIDFGKSEEITEPKDPMDPAIIDLSGSEEEENGNPSPEILISPPNDDDPGCSTTTVASDIEGWIKESLQGVKDHPIASILGVLTAAQPAFNAFLNESHTNAKDFGQKVWDAMSFETKMLSIIELTASFLVNYPAGKKFIGDALEKLKTNTRDMFKSPSDFLDNFFSQLIGIDSGAGAAALTFSAFTWIAAGGVAIPSALGGLSFIITSASRYIGFKRAIQIISNLFNHYANVQRMAIDELKHLKLDNEVVLTAEELVYVGSDPQFADLFHSIREILQAAIDAEVDQIKTQKEADNEIKNKNLTAEDYENLFLKLVEAANTLDKLHLGNVSRIFNKKTAKENLAEYVDIVSKLSFGLTFGLPAAAIFMQEGFNAVNIISKLSFNYDLDTDALNVWYKRLIGLGSGIGSGTLYAVCAADFPKLAFVDLPTYLWQYPKHIASTVVLFAFNYFASYSMRNVTENILKEKNILGLLNEFNKELPYIVQLGGAFVNIRSKLMEYKINAKDPNNPQIEDIIRQNEDPNMRRISKLTADNCSIAMANSSFFGKVNLNKTQPISPDSTPLVNKEGESLNRSLYIRS
ncbi:MAG: hypothetical protein JO149_02645, partial [Gammaproteobacteria bacterium]|nr:hypothetical protein [Gammaproteobacteria bacterium]